MRTQRFCREDRPEQRHAERREATRDRIDLTQLAHPIHADQAELIDEVRERRQPEPLPRLAPRPGIGHDERDRQNSARRRHDRDADLRIAARLRHRVPGRMEYRGQEHQREDGALGRPTGDAECRKEIGDHLRRRPQRRRSVPARSGARATRPGSRRRSSSPRSPATARDSPCPDAERARGSRSSRSSCRR